MNIILLCIYFLCIKFHYTSNFGTQGYRCVILLKKRKVINIYGCSPKYESLPGISALWQ